MAATCVCGSNDPGKVFDLELPLDQAAEGYRAMDERRAIKALLHPKRPAEGAFPAARTRPLNRAGPSPR